MPLDIHIGKMVEAELKRQGRTAKWLAAQLPTYRTNVYSILKRKSLDPDLLMRLSEILQCDFFAPLSEEAKRRISCLRS